MKYLFQILLLFFGLSISTQAQTMEEADSLYNHYQFRQAIEMCETMSAKLIKAKKPEEAETFAPFVERAERAARLLSRCEDIQIIDSIILDKAHFLNAYLVCSEAGHLEIKQDHLYYINQLGDKRYFSERNAEGNRRLFSELKLQEEWTDKQELSLPYDSLANDNFPFVLSDGMTLYYASTGHGSIGGYDLFVSRYNYASNTYFTPSQLGMPFNSPANDYMLVIDEINNIGYFATDRFQEDGKVIVYTYIPNDSVVVIETEDEQELVDRARITSIRDSWKIDSYTAYLRKVKDYIAKEQEKAKREFTFIINDNTIYYTLSEFKSPAARQSFQQWQDLGRQIEVLEKELDKQRKEYARSNVQTKESMKESILKNENRLSGLQKQFSHWATNTRNQEIKHLETNN